MGPPTDSRRRLKEGAATGVMSSVPFFIKNLYGGFAVARGLLRSEPEHLVLEFEVKDEVVGLLSSSVRQVRVPIAHVDAISLRRGLFRTTVTVRSRSMEAVADVPGRDGAEISLRIARKHRDAAAGLVSEVDLKVAETRLDELDRDMTDAASSG